jgi:hypothetical protein
VLARDAHVIRDERGRIDAGKLVPLVVEGNESLHDRFLHMSAHVAWPWDYGSRLSCVIAGEMGRNDVSPIP